MDGAGLETLLDTYECNVYFNFASNIEVMNFLIIVYFLIPDGVIYGLAFDWVVGNIYVVTWAGYILACGEGTTRTFRCYTILDDQPSAAGISLDPAEG